MTTVYEVWRDATFDDSPVHATAYGDRFETKEAASEALTRLAVGADLLYSEYEIRETEVSEE